MKKSSKPKLAVLALTVIALLAITSPAYLQGLDHSIYLPLVRLDPTPSPTAVPIATTGKVVIKSIFYDGTGSTEPDEYVEIENQDTKRIQMKDWTLREKDLSYTFTFPSFEMAPGQVCRIYTNQVHSDWCGMAFGSSTAIWDNTGDCAYLRDSTRTIKSEKCY
jgi:hypothetical protein